MRAGPTVGGGGDHNIDMLRHKEIVVKAVASLLLLMLKHFGVNHVCQAEFLARKMVAVRPPRPMLLRRTPADHPRPQANCIVLVLKLLTQNMEVYLGDTTNDARCSLVARIAAGAGHAPRQGDAALPSDELSGWAPCERNITAVVSLLRVLQRLIKGKVQRTLTLVHVGGPGILARLIRFNHPWINAYVFKVLKPQIKYMGKAWKKTHMVMCSKIDNVVRHHINDRWFYEAQTSAATEEYQWEEEDVMALTTSFNDRRYGTAERDDFEMLRDASDVFDAGWTSVPPPAGGRW